METYLHTWNPDRWDWEDIADDIASLLKTGTLITRWSCGVRKYVQPGSRIFLIKLGPRQPRGIVASGHAISGVYQDEHWEDTDRTSNFIKISWDVLLNPATERHLMLEMDFLKTARDLKAHDWSPQASGTLIPKEVAEALERSWASRLNHINLKSFETAGADPTKYFEGSVFFSMSKRYERDPLARRACLEKHGTTCSVCRFDFSAIYGPELGNGYIQVHHLTPLHSKAGRYEIDPVTDLRPVCPNCHAMLHRKSPPYTVDELKEKMARAAVSS